ncbi:MAG: GntR family transcriptional regulator [Chloroflexi bacterium]|nr:GntR family transcriptional regulator [Chloroflexota bacterium]
MNVAVHRTAADVAFETLRRWIQDGTLAPGHRLLHDDLARDLGMSRIPVREAIRRLEGEGWVVITPHRGAVVASFSVEDVTDLFDIRISLEGLATRLAAGRISAEALQRLHDLHAELERQVAEDDIVAAEAIDAAFHRLLYATSGRPRLCHLIASIWELVARYRLMSYALPLHRELTIRTHYALFGHLERHDAASAERAIIEALTESRDRLIGEVERRLACQQSAVSGQPSAVDSRQPRD